MLFWKVLQY